MKILVTGGTGLIGSNLIHRLDGEILSLSRREGVDLRDEERTHKIFKEFKPEIVYHLADIECNKDIFLNVLFSSIDAGVKKFVFTSSVVVNTMPLPEYGDRKKWCEYILAINSKLYGFDFLIVRPHPIYGPYQNMNDSTRNAVAVFMKNIAQDKECIIYGKSKRCFIYVDDVVDYLMSQENNTIIEIGGKEIMVSTLLKKIEKLTGKKAKKVINAEITSFPVSPLILYGKTPLDQGLQKTWEWVKAL